MRSAVPPRSTRSYRTTRSLAPRLRAPRRDRWLPRTLTSLLVVVLVVAGALVYYEINTADTIYAGVRLGGVDVSGLSRTEALQRLRAASVAPATELLVVGATGQQWNVAPARLGVTLDVQSGVEAAYRLGRMGSPVQRLREQINLLVMGRSLPLTGVYDAARLRSYVQGLAAQVDRPARPAGIAVTAGGPVLQQAQEGLRLDVARTTRLLGVALASGVSTTLHLPVVTVPAPNDVNAARREMARLSGLLNAHITVTALGRQWVLSRDDVANMLRVDTVQRGASVSFVERADRMAVTGYLWPRAASVAQPGRDARLVLDGHAVRVVAGRDGHVVDVGAAVAALSAALTHGGDTTLPLPIVNGPTVSNAEAASVAARVLLTLRTTVVWLPQQHWAIPSAAIAKALTIQRVPAISGARLVPRLDIAAIAAQLPGADALAGSPPRNAAVVKQGARYVVIPGADGHVPDYAALAAEMLASPTPPGRAVYHLPIATRAPALTTAAAEALARAHRTT